MLASIATATPSAYVNLGNFHARLRDNAVKPKLGSELTANLRQFPLIREEEFRP
jgi:hypothetical protein